MEIKDLGYPIQGSCDATIESIKDVNAESQIESASICFGGFGSEEQSYQAVSVEFTTTTGQIIDYIMEMPRGRANRTNVNDYTYFGTWKKGVFFEDQTTVKEEGKFWKAFHRKGVVINYRDNEIELVETYKPAWGKLRTIVDSYISCDNLSR
jgi:hypothetical protein